MINVLPISSILIVAGLILLSAVVANRAKGLILFGRKASWAITFCGAVFCVLGLCLHFKSPPPKKSEAPVIMKSAGSENKKYQISFEPQKAVWGQQVRLKVLPPVDKVDVYLNDNPIPSATTGDGVFTATIPSICKSGYFVVSIKGLKIKASEELIVSAK
jgi:hypothetical protein